MSLFHLCARAAGLCMALALASPASAHVTLDVPQATIVIARSSWLSPQSCLEMERLSGTRIVLQPSMCPTET